MTNAQCTAAYRIVLAARGLEANPGDHNLHVCFEEAMTAYETAGGTPQTLVQLLNDINQFVELKHILEQMIVYQNQP